MLYLLPATLIVFALGIVVVFSLYRSRVIASRLDRREHELFAARSEMRRMRDTFERHVALLEQERELLETRASRAEASYERLASQVDSVRQVGEDLTGTVGAMESRLKEILSRISERALSENRDAIVELWRNESEARISQREELIRPLRDALSQVSDEIARGRRDAADGGATAAERDRLRLVAEQQKRLISEMATLLRQIRTPPRGRA